MLNGYKYTIMPVLTYSSVVTLNLNATQTSRIENLPDPASGVINPSELADLRSATWLVEPCKAAKVGPGETVCRDRNACSNYHNYFKRIQHVKNTRNNGVSVRIPKYAWNPQNMLFTITEQSNLINCPKTLEKLTVLCFLNVNWKSTLVRYKAFHSVCC